MGRRCIARAIITTATQENRARPSELTTGSRIKRAGLGATMPETMSYMDSQYDVEKYDYTTGDWFVIDSFIDRAAAIAFHAECIRTRAGIDTHPRYRLVSTKIETL